MFFEHRGLLEGRDARPVHDTRRVELPLSVPRRGARPTSRRCSPTCARSVLHEGRGGRASCARRRSSEGARGAGRGGRRAARVLRRGRQAARARQRRLGDRRDGRRRRLPRPAAAGWPPRPALDLTEDAAILTAIANDIGVEAIFARQVIAYGRAGDALLALSTSGDSANVIAALAEARRRGLRDDRAASATTAGGSPPRGSPTTSSSRARSTSRASRRRRRAPTTCCASWWRRVSATTRSRTRTAARRRRRRWRMTGRARRSRSDVGLDGARRRREAIVKQRVAGLSAAGAAQARAGRRSSSSHWGYGRGRRRVVRRCCPTPLRAPARGRGRCTGC